MSKEKQQRNRRAAAMDLLRDRQFLFRVGRQIASAGVVGEERNRLILYLACLTAAFEKKVSILVKGPTSTGKNNLAKAVLSLIPRELVLTRSSFSEKALAHGTVELAGKILYLAEHRGGRDAQFYTRLLQSEGALHHEVTERFGQGTRVAARSGSPVFVTTTTDERVYEDDETRYLSLQADDSPELTRQVLRAQFSEKSKGGDK